MDMALKLTEIYNTLETVSVAGRANCLRIALCMEGLEKVIASMREAENTKEE